MTSVRWQALAPYGQYESGKCPASVMTCLGWQELPGSGPLAAAVAAGAVEACPNINWFYWLLAGAGAFVLLAKRKKSVRKKPTGRRRK